MRPPTPTPTRRSVLAALGSAALGGVAGASSTGSAGATDERASERYLVDTQDLDPTALDGASLELVHDLDQIDLAAVVGDAATLDRIGADYGRDIAIQRRPRAQQAQPSPLPEPEASGGYQVDFESENATGEIGTDAPLYPAQWDKQAFDLAALNEVTTGEGTRVAIIDSGIHADHPDLAGQVNLELSQDFTGDGFGAGSAFGGDHGTRCAGVVAANGSALAGTAPGTELVDCRVFTAGRGVTYQSDYLAALVYSADIGCDVANLSLGPGITTPLQVSLYARPAHSRAVEYATQRGTVVVVAAGNDAIDLQRYGLRDFSPGPATMVVSATGPLGFGWPLDDDDGDGLIDVAELEAPIELEAPVSEPSLYSNYGRNVLSVSAPGGNFASVAAANNRFGWPLDMLLTDGVDVQRTDDGGFSFTPQWGWTIGTSFAAPQVSAVVALVRSLAPDLPAAEVTSLIERTARTVDDADPSPYHGAGFLDPLATVEALQ